MAGARRERVTLAALVLVVVLLTVLALAWPQFMPVSALVLPVMVAGWRLKPGDVALLAAVVGVSVGLQVLALPVGRTVWAAIVVVLAVVLAYRYAVLRQRAGLAPGRGLDILMELRDGLRSLGDLPVQPEGWTVVRALRSARGAGMRGDFTLARAGEGLLQVVVVDVTGHGPDVAARASQLSGAFGGLLGAVPPGRLLTCCNQYLLGRGWRETFATAVHLAVDLSSGRAAVWSAGHPPALVRGADGAWRPVLAAGPLLGLVEHPEYSASGLSLAVGDTAVLLSDGLLGADDEPAPALLAAVDEWVEHARLTVDARLLAALPTAPVDDLSLVLVRRDDCGQDDPMGPDDPDDTNPGGLDVDAIEDESGRTGYLVRDDSGIAEVADDLSGLSPAARRRAAAEGFPDAGAATADPHGGEL